MGNTLIRPKGEKKLSEEQFMSIAGDGSILFWEICKPEQTDKDKKKNETAKWTPFYVLKMDKSQLNENIFNNNEAMQLFLEQINEKNKKEFNDSNDSNAENMNGPILGCKMCFTPLIGKICIGSEL